MKGPALLDVNVLVALFNPDHVHHEAAHDWFAGSRGNGWATCAVTETGLLRILSNPTYWSEFERTATLVKRLRQFCGSGNHRFWEQTVSLRDRKLFDLAHLSGHRHITDVYLLGLAQRMGGQLATFDRTIPVKAVIGATSDSLAVIALAG